jgi:hypothetical protein
VTNATKMKQVVKNGDGGGDGDDNIVESWKEN